MHMADSLVSPIIGGGMQVIAAGVLANSIKKIRQDEEMERKTPLMGVIGAFVFAAQMINFTIPGTGSSGHIGGGVLLAAILGPEAGFLVIMSILFVQALLFGDGGLLAYGCNVINMGFFGCFIGYKFVFKKITAKEFSKRRILAGSILGVVIGLQFGAFGVVVETVASGVTQLPFSTFLLFMQPIHLAIGVVEGIVTAGILSFIYENRPDILIKNISQDGRVPKNNMVKRFIIWALALAGVISLFASSNPDGLEWAIEKTKTAAQIESNDFVHQLVSSLQAKTAILMDYNLQVGGINEKIGTAIAGISGVFITAGVILFFLRVVRKLDERME